MGRLTVIRGTAEAASLIQDTLEVMRPLADQKDLHLEGCANDALLLSCDRDRVLQILSNLVGNAIKFTPRGGSVVVRAERAGSEAELMISDTGPGMTEEELSHIGTRFWRARSTAERGFGLGLSIAKGLIEAHGGRLWAESNPGAGTTFHFSLPLATDESERPRGQDAA